MWLRGSSRYVTVTQCELDKLARLKDQATNQIKVGTGPGQKGGGPKEGNKFFPKETFPGNPILVLGKNLTLGQGGGPSP